jgi:serine protease Do
MDGARAAFVAVLVGLPLNAAAEMPRPAVENPPVSASAPSAETPLWIEAPPVPLPADAERADLAPLLGQLERSVVRLSAVVGDPNRRAYATGFVVSTDGYILTADALITGARDLRAAFDDDREIAVEVVGRDPNTEVALLRVAPEAAAEAGIQLVPTALGDSSSLRPGDGVLTLGHGDPEGQSAAQGTVAGRDQRIGPLDRAGSRYLRLDMLLVPGFGGAPLVDLRGRVIGIISAERMASLGSEIDSVSFAVPIETAKRVLPDLLRSKRAPAGWLGVTIQPLDAKLAAGLGLDAGGALVTHVIENSPAARADLKQGDVILEFDGRRILAYRDLKSHLAGTRPGSEVVLVVLRRGARMQLRATIESRDATAPSGGTEDDADAPRFGFECTDLTRELALRYSLPPSTRGVVISEVEPGSPAQLSDLQLGDLVLDVNGKRVASSRALREQLRRENPLVLLIRRGTSTKYVALTR